MGFIFNLRLHGVLTFLPQETETVNQMNTGSRRELASRNYDFSN